MTSVRLRAAVSIRGFVALVSSSFLLLMLSVSPSAAQFTTGFEAPEYSGSAPGVILNGQNGFYDPGVNLSALVFTYAGNAPAFPVNPTGGGQFVGGTGSAGAFVRSQLNVPYGGGTGMWTVAFDTAVKFIGTLPTAQNIGSFSTQDSTTQATFVALAQWADVNTAIAWHASYSWYDAAGTVFSGELVPNPAFQNLAVDHWYRWSTTFDLDTNQILWVSITDLTTAVTATHYPTNRYLSGGAGGLPPPTAFRFFIGGTGVDGNTMAFDNVSIAALFGPVPAPAMSWLGLGITLLALVGVARHRWTAAT